MKILEKLLLVKEMITQLAVGWTMLTLNVKLSNSQLKNLKSAIKNERGLVLRLSSNMVGNDETNFLINYY